jgi:transposase-like protein
MRDIVKAVQRLEDALLRGNGNLPFDEDSQFSDDLKDGGFSWGGPLTDSAARSRIRYIAALFPEKSFRELSEIVTGVLADARDLTASDVRYILAGQDLTTGARTDEVAIEKVQMIGKLLRDGTAKTQIARVAGVSRDTVQAIDWYLGISEAVRQRRIEVACDCVRDGVSVRKAAEKLGVSKSVAHRMLAAARGVLGEIGEVVA